MNFHVVNSVEIYPQNAYKAEIAFPQSVVKMESDLYLVSPKLKALIKIGKRIKGEARSAISKIWKDDLESYIISKADRTHWQLEKLGYAVIDSW
jgi:hypothetical protein